MKKRVISLSVDNRVYAEFVDLCDEKGLIISKQIENFMKEILARNS